MDINTYDRFKVACANSFHEKDVLRRGFAATWDKDTKSWLVPMHRLTALLDAFPRAIVSAEVKALAKLAEVRSVENFLTMLDYFGVILIDDGQRLHAWAPCDLTTRPPSQEDYVSLYQCGWKRGTFTLPTYATHPLQTALDARSGAIREYMASEPQGRTEAPHSATETVEAVRGPSMALSDVHWEGVR